VDAFIKEAWTLGGKGKGKIDRLAGKRIFSWEGFCRKKVKRGQLSREGTVGGLSYIEQSLA